MTDTTTLAQSPDDTAKTSYHYKTGNQGVALDIKDFNLWYGETQALFDTTLPIQKGLVTALIGPSGCGKSTLLRSLNRMNDLVDGLRISGKIEVDGFDIYGKGVDVIALRKRMGMVFQKPNPFAMSIYDNVTYPLRVDGVTKKSILDDTVERCLRSAALWDEAKDRLHDSALGMSGGQQQRLCIARGIASDPEVLLMDEPCSALDPIATAKIENLISQLAGTYTIVIVTHSMTQAARVSHNTAFMYLGRLIEYGKTDTIFTQPKVERTNDYVTGRFG